MFILTNKLNIFKLLCLFVDSFEDVEDGPSECFIIGKVIVLFAHFLPLIGFVEVNEFDLEPIEVPVVDGLNSGGVVKYEEIIHLISK